MVNQLSPHTQVSYSHTQTQVNITYSLKAQKKTHTHTLYIHKQTNKASGLRKIDKNESKMEIKIVINSVQVYKHEKHTTASKLRKIEQHTVYTCTTCKTHRTLLATSSLTDLQGRSHAYIHIMYCIAHYRFTDQYCISHHIFTSHLLVVMFLLIKPPGANIHIPSSMCLRTLQPYLENTSICILVNLLNVLHSAEYQNPCLVNFSVSL